MLKYYICGKTRWKKERKRTWRDREKKLEQSVLIDLTDYFEGRFLKDDYSWGEIADRIKRDTKAIFLILKDEQVNKFLPWYPVKSMGEWIYVSI